LFVEIGKEKAQYSQKILSIHPNKTFLAQQHLFITSGFALPKFKPSNRHELASGLAA
jgi:hypothetical protein